MAENSIYSPYEAAFVPLESTMLTTGLAEQYIGFVICEDAEVIRQLYEVGEGGTVCLEPPDRREPIRGWRYEVKNPMHHSHPGNLVRQLSRPKHDTTVLSTETLPGSHIETQKVWLIPDRYDLVPRRMVSSVNAFGGSPAKGQWLHRYIMGHDLTPPDRQHLFETPDQITEIQTLIGTFSPSQLEAFNLVKGSKHPMTVIQGPPGTGKTTWIVVLLKICTILGIKWLACAPSNAAVHYLAERHSTKYKDEGCIRFFGEESEATEPVKRVVWRPNLKGPNGCRHKPPRLDPPCTRTRVPSKSGKLSVNQCVRKLRSIRISAFAAPMSEPSSMRA